MSASNANADDKSELEPDDDIDLNFALYVRQVYHKILAYIFRNAVGPANDWLELNCGDGVTRFIYPDFLIISVDLEEAHYLCTCRASRANYPCSKCLVPKEDLRELLSSGPLRTVLDMRATYHTARQEQRKTKREVILCDKGLHLVDVSVSSHWVVDADTHNCQNFLCAFRRTNPYDAHGYEKLHSDDHGKNGAHIWPLVLDTLSKSEEDKIVLNRNMGRFPIWPRLENFNPITKPVSDIDYADGETFFGIMKVSTDAALLVF